MKDRAWSSENGQLRVVMGETEQDQIRQLFMNNYLSDVVLLFPALDSSEPSSHDLYDGTACTTSLPAHRLLLSLRSGAFRTAFRESSTSYTSTVLGDKRLRLPLKMVIQDTPYLVFKELLRYIYTGTLEPPVSSTHTPKALCSFWLELVKAATRYDVPALCVLCIEEIESLLDRCQSQVIDIIYLLDSNFQSALSDAVVVAKHRLMALCMSTIMAMPDAEMQAQMKSNRCSTDRLLKIYRERTSAPLVLAVQHQNFRVVDALLDEPTGPLALQQTDDNGILPLVAALESANDSIIRRVLVPAALSWVTLTNSVSVWFLLACASGNLLHCQILADVHHADVNDISAVSTDEFGRGQTPLHIASRYGHVEIVKYLLSLHAVPNFQDHDGNTPLHYASNEPVAEVFLTHNGKCNPNIPNNRGQVPLHLAAMRGDIGVVSLLVHHGADMAAVDEEGQTAFHVAAANGYASVVLVLLKMIEDQAMKVTSCSSTTEPIQSDGATIEAEPKFNINAEDYKNNTALHLAAMAPPTRVEKILQVLLENGADPNRTNWFGYTPLHLFCAHQEGPPSVVAMFIEHGTNIQVQSLDGSTPLHLSVGKASEAVSVALVRAGAPVHVQDVAGRSVVNLAETTSQGIMVVPLLLNVNTPPPWVADDSVLECLNCGESFGMATRKHHCRHCGRIVCGKCSTNRIPLPKFDQQPASRVCDICFDVLSFRKLM
ncbi:hypothetical protein H310_01154 [Aphanomyces invadans]|uniref:FYVE-type domain-containing protein n=1 Tax=Aphanomyces invadans TaxID=157072 RepID=A0A024URX5_9STRA|nr:hypothetical protein H310_01154 [Aphanomyces invadans]ETW08612.1 hypothetical protein H310_01154 [Aphanomyces invadans]|eukprot:XP_008862417.1 hypothetical protein H310_01154 [Aphanomyces invadans]